jgi:hypothetical protein
MSAPAGRLPAGHLLPRRMPRRPGSASRLLRQLLWLICAAVAAAALLLSLMLPGAPQPLQLRPAPPATLKSLQPKPEPRVPVIGHAERFS